MVNTEDNPYEIARLVRARFPIIYRWNENSAMMTADIFLDWFQNQFISTVEKYLSDKRLPSKVILLLDSAPVHPKIIENLHPNIKVLYFPSNTSCHLQPINLYLVKMFKANYIQHALDQVNNRYRYQQMYDQHAGFPPVPDLSTEFHSPNFTIENAINLIGEAWGDISCDLIRHCWRKLIKQQTEDTQLVEPVLEDNHLLASKKKDIEKQLQLIACWGSTRVDIDDLDKMLNNLLKSERADAIDYETLNRGQIELLLETEKERQEYELEQNQREAIRAIQQVELELQHEEQAKNVQEIQPIVIPDAATMKIIGDDHSYFSQTAPNSVHNHQAHQSQSTMLQQMHNLLQNSSHDASHTNCNCQCECLKQILSVLLKCNCTSSLLKTAPPKSNVIHKPTRSSMNTSSKR